MIKIISKYEPEITEELVKIYQESIKNRFRNEDEFKDSCLDSLNRRNCIIFLSYVNDAPACALFSEIMDGNVLLYSLETSIKHRRTGCAKNLLQVVLEYFKGKDVNSVFVHIRKDNGISLGLHQSLGFRIIKDSAKLLDETVSQNYYTLSYQMK